MKYTIEAHDSFLILGVSRKFHSQNGMTEIPKFWDEYYAKGFGEIACGQFGYCFQEKEDGTFLYAIGNRCTPEVLPNGKTIYHIWNRPDCTVIPEGFELIEVPAGTWLKAECLGPIPQSIQNTYPLLMKEWPNGIERIGGCELEEYGLCTCAEDSQREDYCCHIWVPVKERVC